MSEISVSDSPSIVPDLPYLDEAQPAACEAATLAAVAQWAAHHQISRAEACRRLIRIGLNAAPVVRPALCPDRAAELAITQLDALIDPQAPPVERERRVARLIEGPAEFTEARVDLPRRRRTDRPVHQD